MVSPGPLMIQELMVILYRGLPSLSVSSVCTYLQAFDAPLNKIVLKSSGPFTDTGPPLGTRLYNNKHEWPQQRGKMPLQLGLAGNSLAVATRMLHRYQVLLE